MSQAGQPLTYLWRPTGAAVLTKPRAAAHPGKPSHGGLTCRVVPRLVPGGAARAPWHGELVREGAAPRRGPGQRSSVKRQLETSLTKFWFSTETTLPTYHIPNVPCPVREKNFVGKLFFFFRAKILKCFRNGQNAVERATDTTGAPEDRAKADKE